MIVCSRTEAADAESVRAKQFSKTKHQLFKSLHFDQATLTLNQKQLNKNKMDSLTEDCSLTELAEPTDVIIKIQCESSASIPVADPRTKVSMGTNICSAFKSKAITMIVVGLVNVALIGGIVNKKGTDVPRDIHRDITSPAKGYSTRGRVQRELLMVKDSTNSMKKSSVLKRRTRASQEVRIHIDIPVDDDEEANTPLSDDEEAENEWATNLEARYRAVDIQSKAIQELLERHSAFQSFELPARPLISSPHTVVRSHHPVDDFVLRTSSGNGKDDYAGMGLSHEE